MEESRCQWVRLRPREETVDDLAREAVKPQLRAVIDPWFSDQEKRTILLSWVRDELVKEQVAVKPHSQIDAVIEALWDFDPPAAGEYLSACVPAALCSARPK